MRRRRFASITALGLATIAAYGAWFYAFGVLLDPIIIDTGWVESALTAGFAAGLALGSLLSVPAGRLLDRIGSRPIFVLAGVTATVTMWLGASADSVLMFVISTGITGVALSALGFYHITQTTAVRVAPDEPTNAIALLTIYGAFASAIYLPLTAYLVESLGWRSAMRTLAVVTGVVLGVAAMVVREEERSTPGGGSRSMRVVLRRPAVRRFVVAAGLSGVMVGIVLVYQVPLMTAAGLPLATASWFAGARGVAQVTGRIPLAPMVRRLGARRALVAAYSATVIGVALLTLSGNFLGAAAFTLVAGFGVGAASALYGVYSDVIFERSQLGAMMGLVTLVSGVSTAAGPAIAGIVADLTGSRWWSLLVAGTVGIGAVAVLGRGNSTGDSATSGRLGRHEPDPSTP